MFQLLAIVLLIIFLPVALSLVLTGGLGLFAILTVIPTSVWVVVGGSVFVVFAGVIISGILEAEAEIKARKAARKKEVEGGWLP